MIISKYFMSPNPRAAWKKLFSSPPDKSFLRLWSKYFLTEIYRNIQTFDFKMLRECSSWASRNGAVQMFFTDTNQKHIFGCVCRSIFFILFSELRFVKSVKFFDRNCIVKWVTSFASFCCLWDTLQENLKLEDKLQISGF